MFKAKYPNSGKILQNGIFDFTFFSRRKICYIILNNSELLHIHATPAVLRIGLLVGRSFVFYSLIRRMHINFPPQSTGLTPGDHDGHDGRAGHITVTDKVMCSFLTKLMCVCVCVLLLLFFVCLFFFLEMGLL